MTATRHNAKELVTKLARLNGRFTDLLLEDPDLWDRLPPEFTPVFQDLADPELSAYALEVAGKVLREAGEAAHVFFHGEDPVGVLYRGEWIPLGVPIRASGRAAPFGAATSKRKLTKAVALSTALPEKEVGAVLEAFLRLVGESLAAGKKVVFPGLGTLEVRKRKARTGLEPETKAFFDFRPDKDLEDALRT